MEGSSNVKKSHFESTFAIIESGETGRELTIMEITPGESTIEYILVSVCKILNLIIEEHIITYNTKRYANDYVIPTTIIEDNRAPIFVLHSIHGKSPSEVDTIFGSIHKKKNPSNNRLRKLASVPREVNLSRLYQHVLEHAEFLVRTSTLSNISSIQLLFPLDSSQQSSITDQLYVTPFWNILLAEQPRDVLVTLLDLLKTKIKEDEGLQISTTYLLRHGIVKWIVEF